VIEEDSTVQKTAKNNMSCTHRDRKKRGEQFFCSVKVKYLVQLQTSKDDRSKIRTLNVYRENNGVQLTTARQLKNASRWCVELLSVRKVGQNDALTCREGRVEKKIEKKDNISESIKDG
jgi:hypothetical protein